MQYRWFQKVVRFPSGASTASVLPGARGILRKEAFSFLLILLPLLLYVTIFAVNFVILNKRCAWLLYYWYTHVTSLHHDDKSDHVFSHQWTRRWFLQFSLSVPSNWEQPAQCVHAWVWVPKNHMLWRCVSQNRRAGQKNIILLSIDDNQMGENICLHFASQNA